MVGDKPAVGARPSNAQLRAQRRRSIAIGATLVGLVLLFYVMTLFKFAGAGGWPV